MTKHQQFYVFRCLTTATGHDEDKQHSKTAYRALNNTRTIIPNASDRRWAEVFEPHRPYSVKRCMVCAAR
jgi:hypothetical protein